MIFNVFSLIALDVIMPKLSYFNEKNLITATVIEPEGIRDLKNYYHDGKKVIFIYYDD